ncbi:unnamed protein product [Acanthoscelides obtectus]|uniref:Uncharacterized protein n=1 Tax=Acanthoscelides obtectus TaxID=200917 RepID=A0A9P0LZA8_ACAOB|nr:unnamed protein product [Acanthoscelides obtectus]CAK1643249.1 hypothetical protein AOBTE_LOCUS13464 [Acanthoscelides obtectus]
MIPQRKFTFLVSLSGQDWVRDPEITWLDPILKDLYREHGNIGRKVQSCAHDWSIEQVWRKFKDTIFESARDVCDLSKMNKNMKQTAWWTPETKQHVKEKKNKWKTYLHRKTTEAYDEYKIQRNNLKKLIIEEKRKYWEGDGAE